MREGEGRPVIPPEGLNVTPEEHRRILESGEEFKAEKKALEEGRARKEGLPVRQDYSDQSKILEGQKARIIRAKIATITGSSEAPLPSDFADKSDMNDYGAIRAAKFKNLFAKIKNLFR